MGQKWKSILSLISSSPSLWIHHTPSTSRANFFISHHVEISAFSSSIKRDSCVSSFFFLHFRLCFIEVTILQRHQETLGLRELKARRRKYSSGVLQEDELFFNGVNLWRTLGRLKYIIAKVHLRFTLSTGISTTRITPRAKFVYISGNVGSNVCE